MNMNSLPPVSKRGGKWLSVFNAESYSYPCISINKNAALARSHSIAIRTGFSQKSIRLKSAGCSSSIYPPAETGGN